MGYLGRFVRGYDYDLLAKSTAKLEEEVLDNLNEKVNPWGVTVNEFYVTDFVPAKQYRLFGDAPFKWQFLYSVKKYVHIQHDY